MAMANFFSLHNSSFTAFTSINHTKYQNLFQYPSLIFSSNPRKHKRELPLLALASSAMPLSAINVDYLEKEFGNSGVGFEGIGDSCVVRIALENGSVATLMLPSGLITSYKPKMWYGSTLEVLHTKVTEGEDGSPVIQGGVSVDFCCGSDDGLLWSPRTWVLRDVRGSPEEFIQVELISSDSDNMVEFKYILTLQQDILMSELVILNSKVSSLKLFGSFTSHLAVSTPDASYAIGLEGSNYCSNPPFESDFSIVPEDFNQSKPKGSGQTRGVQELLQSSWGARDQINGAETNGGFIEEEEEEEDDNYKQLTETMCRIYTYAPRQLTIIDRGKRNSIVVGRDGFDELYLFSPGSNHEVYGKFAFVCTGPSAMLKPIILGPQCEWRGNQTLYNPNM